MTMTVLAVAAGLTFGQSKTVADFQRKYQNDRDATMVHLNGGLFKLLASIATFDLGDEDEDAEVVARISNGIKSMDILSIPLFESGLMPEGFEELRQNLLKEKYEELMEVRDGRNNVSFLSQGTDSEVKNMVVLVREDDKAVVMNVNGTLDMRDLAYLARHSQKFN